jgi:nicotinamidase-related amidase
MLLRWAAGPAGFDWGGVMDCLVVVDMQNDFVGGALGSAEAVGVVPRVAERLRAHGGGVVFTMDTHGADYAGSHEGGLLPVAHCIKGTEGWKLVPEIEALRAELEARRPESGVRVFEKPSFGSVALAEFLVGENAREPIGGIELVGLCTDICVVSNALLLRAFLPETDIWVRASCCAGTSPENHEAALAVMESCQVRRCD